MVTKQASRAKCFLWTTSDFPRGRGSNRVPRLRCDMAMRCRRILVCVWPCFTKSRTSRDYPHRGPVLNEVTARAVPELSEV